jgi:starch phosphorylase
MKAAMNGVLNFSVHDGWWLEACVEGQNGWGIGRRPEWSDLSGPEEGEDENDLFSKLSYLVLPTYYQNQTRWLEMARASIATVGPLFNSYRMAEDYIARVYSDSSAGS